MFNVRVLDGARDAAGRAAAGERLEELVARAAAALGCEVLELWHKNLVRVRSVEEILESRDLVFYAATREDLGPLSPLAHLLL
eukprot:tig00021314_g20111.t1